MKFCILPKGFAIMRKIVQMEKMSLFRNANQGITLAHLNFSNAILDDALITSSYVMEVCF